MLQKNTLTVLVMIIGLMIAVPTFAGVNTANGWYEGEEIYYIDGGIEDALFLAQGAGQDIAAGFDDDGIAAIYPLIGIGIELFATGQIWW